MDITKRAAAALTGLAFAGTTALVMSAATPASATVKVPAGHSKRDAHNGSGDGSNVKYYQPYRPQKIWLDNDHKD